MLEKAKKRTHLITQKKKRLLLLSWLIIPLIIISIPLIVSLAPSQPVTVDSPDNSSHHIWFHMAQTEIDTGCADCHNTSAISVASCLDCHPAPSTTINATAYPARFQHHNLTDPPSSYNTCDDPSCHDGDITDVRYIIVRPGNHTYCGVLGCHRSDIYSGNPDCGTCHGLEDPPGPPPVLGGIVSVQSFMVAFFTLLTSPVVVMVIRRLY